MLPRALRSCSCIFSAPVTRLRPRFAATEALVGSSKKLAKIEGVTSVADVAASSKKLAKVKDVTVLADVAASSTKWAKVKDVTVLADVAASSTKLAKVKGVTVLADVAALSKKLAKVKDVTVADVAASSTKLAKVKGVTVLADAVALSKKMARVKDVTVLADVAASSTKLAKVKDVTVLADVAASSTKLAKVKGVTVLADVAALSMKLAKVKDVTVLADVAASSTKLAKVKDVTVLADVAALSKKSAKVKGVTVLADVAASSTKSGKVKGVTVLADVAASSKKLAKVKDVTVLADVAASSTKLAKVKGVTAVADVAASPKTSAKVEVATVVADVVASSQTSAKVEVATVVADVVADVAGSFRKSAKVKGATVVADVVADVAGSFRKSAKVKGVTVVADETSALVALKELQRLQDRPHAWDTETADITLARGGLSQSPVSHGRIVCATCFCGEDADFGNGPRLFIDNVGPASGLLEKYFKPYFESDSFQKIFHNYSFDRHMLGRHGVQLRGFHADTLHLARLYDTSLSSWEGNVRAKLAREEEERKGGGGGGEGEEQMVQMKPVPTRAVLGVSLGGVQLEKRAWSNTTAGAAVPSQEALATSLATPPTTVKKAGYELKNLASYFDLAQGRQKSFPELFGVHETAAQEVHDSPERFAEWVQYSTNDAVLTFQLFLRMKAELVKREWNTPVHQKHILNLLRDDNVAEELRNMRSLKVRGVEGGSSAGTYGSTQHATGQNMWDMSQLYLREFAECLADLEQNGVSVNLQELREIEAQSEQDAEIHQKAFAQSFSSMRGLDGELLNPNADLINVRSSPQLRMLLFGGASNLHDDSLQLENSREFMAAICREEVSAADSNRGEMPPPRKNNRFEIRSVGLLPAAKRKDFSASGWPKTSKDVLARLAGDSSTGRAGLAMGQLLEQGLDAAEAGRVAEGLRNLRAATKAKAMLSGFARPLQRHATEAGRIHPSWQFDTATGRLACRSPNLQNLPSIGQDKYRIRHAIQAVKGKAFVIADYSQLELRVLAHVSECKTMIEKLSKGGDYHSEVAAEMFPHVHKALRLGEVTISEGGAEQKPTVKSLFAKERSSAKAINFGIMYGMSAVTLAEELGIETHDAEMLMEAWYKTKPEVRKWQLNVQADSKRTKRAVSLLGRWRMLPLLDEQASFTHRFRSMRAAVNFGVQGSAADIVLAAMLRLWREPRLKELGYRIVMQVHDEFVLEGPEAHAQKAASIVKEVMMNPFSEKSPDFSFRLPLEVDVATGYSLADKA